MRISEEILFALGEARSVAVLTGAGISAESGIATFRDAGGLWQQFKAQELASMEGFLANPDRVWQWYQYRREIIANVKPNPGHYALAELERFFPDFTLVTQNIDRLHQRAGSRNVVELHGNIIENHCLRCKKPHEVKEDLNSENNGGKEVPRCEYCGGLIRPSVVWFGEMLPVDAFEIAETAAEMCDVFFSIGTSAEVYPAANLSHMAKRRGAFLVEINPDFTSISGIADACIHAPSGEALPEIVKKLRIYRKENI